MAKKTDPLIGQQVGNYEVKSLLGRGGMGAVYLAENPMIGKEVAIKVLASHLAQQEQLAARFISEARAVTRIQHPNVIEIYDFGKLPEGEPYYVMQKLEGRELAAVIKAHGAMAPRQVLPYLEQVCQGLQAAHDRGVVHRDLKPENIFVLQGEPVQVKLLDFGIAKVLEGDDAVAQTATGMLLGTPHFISPEQAAAKRDLIGPASDIYSLGVILYWMLSGDLPFADKSVGPLLIKHISEAPPPLRDKKPEVPTAVAEVVHRCLEKDPADRPASPTELLRAFQGALADGPVDTLPGMGERATLAAEAAALCSGASSRESRPPSPRTPTASLATPAAAAARPASPGPETAMMDRTGGAAQPPAPQTELGSLSEIFGSPPGGLSPQGPEIPAALADRPATGRTTMGGATGELGAALDSAAAPGSRTGLWVALGLAAAVLAGGGGFLALGGGGGEPGRSVAAAPAAVEPAQAAPRSPPPAEPAALPGPEEPVVEHLLSVSVRGPAATCTLAAAAGGRPEEQRAPCRFSRASGSELQLTVSSAGLKAHDQVWDTARDLDLALGVHPEGKMLMLVAELERITPEKKSQEASAAASPRPAPARPARPRPVARPGSGASSTTEGGGPGGSPTSGSPDRKKPGADEIKVRAVKAKGPVRAQVELD